MNRDQSTATLETQPVDGKYGASIIAQPILPEKRKTQIYSFHPEQTMEAFQFTLVFC